MKYERVLSLSHEMIFQCQAHLWLDDRHVPGAWRSSPFVAGFLMIDECTTNTTVCVRRLGVWVPHHRWSHHSSELACLDDFIRSIHGSAPSTSSGHSVFDTRASQLNCRPETNKYKKKKCNHHFQCIRIRKHKNEYQLHLWSIPALPRNHYCLSWNTRTREG